MATPIQNTPVLYGEDALRFEEMLEASRHKKIPPAERAAMRARFRRVKIINRELDAARGGS